VPLPPLSLPRELVRHWLASVRRPEVRSELEAVYAEASRAIAERGPACWASGRCCNFEKTGHLLYVTGLEVAYVVDSMPAATPIQSTNPGRCSLQSDSLCGVHLIKPLGCRVFFCDRSARQWQHDLSERLLASIRRIHDAFDIEYRYAEWRSMLSEALAHRE
jgi:Fe-S-cluster containining protein